MTNRLMTVTTKGGFHVSAGSRRHFGQVLLDCYAAQTPVAVVFSVGQDVWPDVRRTYPPSMPDADMPTKVIFRTQTDYHGHEVGDGPGDMFTNPNPRQCARDFMSLIMPVWTLNKAHYYAPINEQDGAGLEDMIWLDPFLDELMTVAEQHNYRLALPGWSVGNPRDGQTDLDTATLEQRWACLLSSMRHAKQGHHALILHEYGLDVPEANGGPAGSLQASYPYQAGRLFRSLAYLTAHDADPDVTFVTEASAGTGFLPAIGSMTRAQWLDDADWYDHMLQRYKKVGGCCFYQYGGAENLESIALELSTQMQHASQQLIDELPYGQGAESMFGLHGRSGSPHRDADWDALRLARPTVSWFKALTNMDVDDLSRIIMEGIRADHIILRLYFDTNRPERVTPAQFVDWQMIHLTRFNALGCKYVEVHNEPNLPQEGLGTQWNGPNEFSAWFNEVRSIIKTRFPSLLVGMPGLSPQPNVPEWLSGCASAYQMCDWVGVHCYFVNDNQLTDPEHGGYWQKFAQFNKDMIITEFSNPDAGVGKSVKANQYLQYVNGLAHPKIKAAICYIVSGTGFDNEAWVDEAGNLSVIPEIVGNGIIDPPNFDEMLWNKSVEWQTASGIQLNSDAALQQAIKRDNLWPVTTELYEGDVAYMAAEDPTPNGKARRVYVWQNGAVRWFNKPIA